ncbi:hypothetical protein PybrP1_009357 [[Pythium] brassicae (nom. inval.)]|nr:hypothetical protein PybrP1_009357 [[Pythium] brassicae (nom. inval.)]
MAITMHRLLQRARALLAPQTQTPLFAPALLQNAAVAAPPAASADNSLFDALWLAAPKSKVTPRVKRIRNNALPKRLKNIVHFQDCTMCGQKKLRHRLCMSCFKKGKYFV